MISILITDLGWLLIAAFVVAAVSEVLFPNQNR